MHKLRQMGRLQYPVGWREAAGHPNFVVGQRRWLRSTQIAGKPTGNVGGWVWLSHIENLRPELCSYSPPQLACLKYCSMSQSIGCMESEVIRLQSALPVALLFRKGLAKFCMACGICLRALVRLPLLQRLDIAGHCWTRLPFALGMVCSKFAFAGSWLSWRQK